MSKVTDEMMRAVNDCSHDWNWDTVNHRRCSRCGVGEQVLTRKAMTVPESRLNVKSEAGMLRELADKFEDLEFENNRIKSAVLDALGTRHCICGMCIGDPRVKDHSLQCRILRGLVGIES